MYKITEERYRDIKRRMENIHDIVFRNADSKEDEEFDKIDSEIIMIESLIKADRFNIEIQEFYAKIKKESDESGTPVEHIMYCFRDFDNVIQIACVTINYRDTDIHNRELLNKTKNKYGEFFMFFGRTEEGRKFSKGLTFGFK